MRREKEIQAECSTCFMVNMLASYKDTAYLYMLMECVMGGELFTYLQVAPHSSSPPPPPPPHQALHPCCVQMLLRTTVA